MSQKEERICQMFGESCGCAGKPEQDSHRGAQSSQRHLLPQARITLTNTAQGLCDSQTTRLFSSPVASPGFDRFCSFVWPNVFIRSC